jgi:hypothetical protein
LRRCGGLLCDRGEAGEQPQSNGWVRNERLTMPVKSSWTTELRREALGPAFDLGQERIRVTGAALE